MSILYEYRREQGCQYKYGIVLSNEDSTESTYELEFDTPEEVYNFKKSLTIYIDTYSAGLTLSDINRLKTPC